MGYSIVHKEYIGGVRKQDQSLRAFAKLQIAHFIHFNTLFQLLITYDLLACLGSKRFVCSGLLRGDYVLCILCIV